MNKSKILLLVIFLISASCPRLFAGGHGLSDEFLFSLAEAYFKENRYTDAKTELKKCLMLNPQHKQARQLLQRCEKKPVEFTKDKLREEAMQLALEETQKEMLQEKALKTKPPVSPSERTTRALREGTWQLKQGDFYGEIDTRYYWHNQEFDNKGHKKRWNYGGGYYEIKTEYKLEYGLTDRYTLLIYPVFKRVNWEDDYQDRTRAGFVEIWPGIKYLLSDEPFPCWLRGRMKIPFNYREGEGVAAALGSHQIDGEIKLLTSQPWPKLPGYTKFELGFRGRNEEPSNEIIYLSQLGYNVAKNLLLELSLDGQEGLAQTGGVDEDWVKYTIGPIFKVGLFNIKFGYGNTFAGKNTSAAREAYLSIYTWW